jgi:uncharacterized SAM-binding protein YcdF (DUF218 family)
MSGRISSFPVPVKIRRRGIVSGVVLICVLICAVAVLFAFSGRILWSLGAVLNAGEPPRKADLIVVIGGDVRGSRILTGAELVREGYAPKVLVSGGGDFYGFHESDLAIDFAVQHGYPRDIFIPFRYAALSTANEAQEDIQELRRLGVHKYLLVTSIYHTARAGRTFRREGPDLEVHPISAPERYWHNGEWWQDREGRKLWLEEAVKTIADFLRI